MVYRMYATDFDKLVEDKLTAKQITYIECYVENTIKTNLDTIILCILKEGPMCGYDVIRSIFAKYDTFLSQGIVYPILYLLTYAGILKAEVDQENMGLKIYSLTPKGEKIVKDREKCFDTLMIQPRVPGSRGRGFGHM